MSSYSPHPASSLTLSSRTLVLKALSGRGFPSEDWLLGGGWGR